MIVYRLHLIRHAKTIGNLEGRFVGTSDLPILPQSAEQIASFKRENIYPKVSRVYTSPLLRCKQTAELIYPDEPIEIVNGIRELDFGTYEGKTLDEVVHNDSTHFLNLKDQFPDGENIEEMLERVAKAVDYIIADMQKRQITSAATITHAGVISMILATWGLPREQPYFWLTENGCGYTLLIQPNIWEKDQAFEIYDKIEPAPFLQLDEDAYLDYAEELVSEEDLIDPDLRSSY